MARDIKQTMEFHDGPGTRINKPVKGVRVRPRRAHAVEITGGPVSPARVGLDRDRISIGRAQGTVLQLDSDEVSRNHAQLTRLDDEYTIEDLGSRNGIYLNGVKVHAAVLRDGDELQLGDVFLLYHEGN
ncbi:MAG: FHA domain-containing protein [Myxococcaceae bacterium]|nr:FHA domain-containing protein [Myxococcaceae bacterium]